MTESIHRFGRIIQPISVGGALWRRFWAGWPGAVYRATTKPAFDFGDSGAVCKDVTIGSAQVGTAIMRKDPVSFGASGGKPTDGGRIREVNPDNRFAWGSLERADPDWLEQFHSFAWLDHLVATGDDDATRKWLGRFFDEYLRSFASFGAGDYSRRVIAPVWRVEVAVDRYYYWLQHRRVIFEALGGTRRGPDGVARRFGEALNRHRMWIRGLWRISRVAVGLAPITAALLGEIAVPEAKRDEKAVAGLKRALAAYLGARLQPDGSVVPVSPLNQFLAARELYRIGSIIDDRPRRDFDRGPDGIAKAAAEAAARAIDAMRFMLQADGAPALFRGSHESDAAEIARLSRKFRPSASDGPKLLKDAAMARLARAKSVAIMELATSAAALGFEFGSNGRRIVVSCGSRFDLEANLEGTAAHSGIEVGGCDARPDRCTLTPKTGSAVIEASHDGYLKSHGIGVTRRLSLTDEGGLIGKDVLTGPRGRDYRLYFHLHPNAKAVALASGRDVIIRDGRRQIWRFTLRSATGASLRTIPSLYCGLADVAVPCTAITVSGRTAAAVTRIDWGLSGVKGR